MLLSLWGSVETHVEPYTQLNRLLPQMSKQLMVPGLSLAGFHSACTTVAFSLQIIYNLHKKAFTNCLLISTVVFGQTYILAPSVSWTNCGLSSQESFEYEYILQHQNRPRATNFPNKKDCKASSLLQTAISWPDRFEIKPLRELPLSTTDRISVLLHGFDRSWSASATTKIWIYGVCVSAKMRIIIPKSVEIRYSHG